MQINLRVTSSKLASVVICPRGKAVSQIHGVAATRNRPPEPYKQKLLLARELYIISTPVSVSYLEEQRR